MTPAAAAVLSVLGVLAWILLALLFAIAIGRSIREADRRETHRQEPHANGPKDCCPHDVEQAPETIRGQFRAIVLPPRTPAEQPAERLDTYL